MNSILGPSGSLGMIRNDSMLMELLWTDRHIQMYGDAQLPIGDSCFEKYGAVFLLGPTSRNQLIELNWRKNAAFFLRHMGFHGWIYVPENRGGYGRDWSTSSAMAEFDAPEWETDRWLHPKTRATISWIPRDDHELLGLNTNWEEGFQCGAVEYGAPHEGIFIGWPDDAKRMKLPRHYLNRMAKKGWNKETNFSNDLCNLCRQACNYLNMTDVNQKT